ncbi:MAG: hypothetical protein JXM71_03205, partial [Spirochaetales bacterium]|nr:hypothetical protein [Spirochaetales bacterium]
EQGSTKADVSRALSGSIPAGGLLVCGAEADSPELREAVTRVGARLRVASPSLPGEALTLAKRLSYEEFDENLAVALEVCDDIGLDRSLALLSMAGVVPDFGALRTWSWIDDELGVPVSFTNAFAANDVESSLIVLDRVTKDHVAGADKVARVPIVGVLNLRADRGERTLQWLRAFRGGLVCALDEVRVVGTHARILERRLSGSTVRCVAEHSRNPAALIRGLLACYPAGVRIVGLGNIAGAGGAIVEWCAARGTYDAG